MFATKDEIRQTVQQIINDDANNDIVFIIANKGFGKYKLLKEINEIKYQKGIIITDGNGFHSDSVLKNCLMQGIYEFLKRNNNFFHRNFLAKLISNTDKVNFFSDRLWFSLHIKMIPQKIENLLKYFSFNEIVNIYKEFSSNTPLVFFIYGNELSGNDETLLSKFNSEIDTAKFTYIIALRPNSAGKKLIKNVMENRNERIWILPLIPTIRDSVRNLKIINIPSISLNNIKNQEVYDDFKVEIMQKDYYNSVFKIVDKLLGSGINPPMIFTVAAQEISYIDFDYLSTLTILLLHKTKIYPYNDALLAHDGKFMWIDTLVYYLFVNESIEKIILELQRFYFAFMTNISNQNSNSNSFTFLQILAHNKKRKNQINIFLKKMSHLSNNPLIPDVTRYISNFSSWMQIFLKNISSDKINSTITDSLINQLYSFDICFSDIIIQALQIINQKTECLGALDIGLLTISRKLTANLLLTSSEISTIHSFVNHCLNEMLRWNDVTLIEKVCDVLFLLKQNNILAQYNVPEICNNYSMYRCLSYYMKNKNLKIGEVIMGRKTIFISYTATDVEIVDTIDAYLSACGYDVKRDIRNINDYDSIDKFMNEIRKEDFVIPVVSDTYLRRNNCMYEITQLLKDSDFERRTFPIVIDFPKTSERTYSFFDIQYRIEIGRFWEQQAQNLNAAIEELSLENKAELSKEYRKIKNYAQTVLEFLDWFKSKLVGVVPADIDSVNKQLVAQDIAYIIDSKISANA